jgi:hypothetical protein
MLMGLTNVLASFQAMTNYIFKDPLDQGVVVYIYDILIYTKNTEQHNKYVDEVLEGLANNDLVSELEKYVWAEGEVECLGNKITSNGMRMALEKMEAIQDWQTPQSLRDVQSFLRFANFFRQLIFGFSEPCYPLTESTKKDKKD